VPETLVQEEADSSTVRAEISKAKQTGTDGRVESMSAVTNTTATAPGGNVTVRASSSNGAGSNGPARLVLLTVAGILALAACLAC
jgi:hypothetical protein